MRVVKTSKGGRRETFRQIIVARLQLTIQLETFNYICQARPNTREAPLDGLCPWTIDNTLIMKAWRDTICVVFWVPWTLEGDNSENTVIEEAHTSGSSKEIE